MVFRLILPEWATSGSLPKVLEGQFSDDQVQLYNEQGYNCYFLPNEPSVYDAAKPVAGHDIDTFSYVFIDMDLKSGVYSSKEEFISYVKQFEHITPSVIVDSGNGIHCYWRVTDLDARSFLKLQRRIMRQFKTDEAVCKIYQLMRVPGTMNTKDHTFQKLCEVIATAPRVYTCEELDKQLPPLTTDDARYCDNHYNKTYEITDETIKINETLPHKFTKLIATSREVKELYAGDITDRSKADYRLAHIMFAEGFTKEEAMSVLVNCKKALERTPVHRVNYASNIADKVWVYENSENKDTVQLSNSVKDILKRGVATQGTKFPCWEVFDGTHSGFRLTQVLGLIGGAGSGKTTLALNYFYWFTLQNPDFIHLFVSLEQPEEEIAIRWARLAEGKEHLHDKVHVLSNYNADGSYRNLSLSNIEDYVIELQTKLGTKVGCVVIDHIGVLNKKSKEGENQGLIDICHNMKAFAKRTNTFLVMQSQTSREKAGVGDLELDKDAAYGTSMFEWYCDYIVTTWQPLKRVYSKAADMSCSAFKYCKIRHKNIRKDRSKEDVVHVLMYDPDTELLREMTQMEEDRYEFLNKQATTIRNKDRKREPTRITKIDWTTTKPGEVAGNGKTVNN